MNPLYELGRYAFLVNRDGEAAAKAFARRSFKGYLAAVKANRKKQGRMCAYRREFLQGAYSFRHILRHA